MKMKLGFVGVAVAVLLGGCASGPGVKQQSYAKLASEHTFEEEFATVWKGIEAALRGYKITERDPEEVDEVELKRLTERSIETDWVYGRSRDKYIEYKVNGKPRRQYLQTRIRYEVEAERVLGGVRVGVKLDEEVERLNADGTPDGYESVESTDTSRTKDLIEKIRNAMLSAP